MPGKRLLPHMRTLAQISKKCQRKTHRICGLFFGMSVDNGLDQKRLVATAFRCEDVCRRTWRRCGRCLSPLSHPEEPTAQCGQNAECKRDNMRNDRGSIHKRQNRNTDRIIACDRINEQPISAPCSQCQFGEAGNKKLHGQSESEQCKSERRSAYAF